MMTLNPSTHPPPPPTWSSPPPPGSISAAEMMATQVGACNFNWDVQLVSRSREINGSTLWIKDQRWWRYASRLKCQNNSAPFRLLLLLLLLLFDRDNTRWLSWFFCLSWAFLFHFPFFFEGGGGKAEGERRMMIILLLRLQLIRLSASAELNRNCIGLHSLGFRLRHHPLFYRFFWLSLLQFRANLIAFAPSPFLLLLLLLLLFLFLKTRFPCRC